MTAEQAPCVTKTGLRVVVGGRYRWKGRTVDTTFLFETTEGPFASVHEAGSGSRRNVPADELEAWNGSNHVLGEASS